LSVNCFEAIADFDGGENSSEGDCLELGADEAKPEEGEASLTLQFEANVLCGEISSVMSTGLG